MLRVLQDCDAVSLLPSLALTVAHVISHWTTNCRERLALEVPIFLLFAQRTFSPSHTRFCLCFAALRPFRCCSRCSTSPWPAASNWRPEKFVNKSNGTSHKIKLLFRSVVIQQFFSIWTGCMLLSPSASPMMHYLLCSLSCTSSRRRTRSCSCC